MKRLLSLALLAFSTAALAGEAEIRATVAKLQPGAEITSITPSPLAGLQEVQIKGYSPVYMTNDGRYFIGGDVMFLNDAGRVENLTDAKARKERAEWLSKVPDADQIIYSPKGKPKATVYVFTDVDCGYCRKFHTEMQGYNALGIEVRYLAYPRSGVSSGAGAKEKTVWCSKDRKAAITKVKAGGDIPTATCDDPVSRQYNLGKTLGVTGTPAIFTTGGEQIGGFLTPEQIKKSLHL